MKILSKIVSGIRELGRLSIIFLIFFSLFYFSRDYRINKSDAIFSAEESILYLEDRINLEELANLLENHDIEYDENELRWVASLLGWRNFASGRYEIEGAYSYDDFLSKLALGLQDHAPVTIHPGISIERLSVSLGRQLKADSDAFNSIFSDSSNLMQDLGYTPESLFSRMLPDTYNIYWTSDPESVIKRVYDEFTRRVTERFQEELENHSMNLDEIITLASIIEWEARFDQEKPRISGLYWNRLNRGMRLQADPTVIYALGEHRRLLYEDYQYDHPYNTYINNGLPPGPITNPDIRSIEAAISPEDHEYLYMVANPEGGHVFTRTFEEHRVASAEWRRWIREQFRIRDEMERLQEEETN